MMYVKYRILKSCQQNEQIVMKNKMYKYDCAKQNNCVTRETRRVPLVNQEVLTFPEHMSSPPLLVRFV